MGVEGINISKKKAYLIGLITVVFLTVFNQLLIQKVLSEQKFDATVINLAGRQRMLSQKIVKESYQVIEGAYELQKLKREVIVWDNIHKGLQEGDAGLGLPKLNSEHLQELFDELSPAQYAISSTILNADSSEQLNASLSIILENEKVFLPKMDELVSVFEQESGIRIRNLILLEILLAFFSLIVLLIEFRYIFRPLFDGMQKENKKLEDTVAELSDSKGKLFQSTQRFDLSLEAINAGIWDWYIPEGTEWWSDKFYSLLGYKPNEIPATYSTFLYELVHPDDREKVEKAVKAHLEEKKAYKIEIRMKQKSGIYRWFESVGQASWDFENNPIRMVGSIIDIEEKKQFESQIISDEQALRIQKAELEKALKDISEIQEVAKIGTWEVDLKTMRAYWSDEVYRIHEVPNGEQIKVEEGINFYREDFRPVIQNAIDTAIAEKKSWDEECILITKSGKELWVRAIGFPVFEHGDLVALRGLFMDIDERRIGRMNLETQKEKLEEVSTKLSLAVNTGNIGVWVWDIETNGLEWDDQMLEIYGITREQFTNGYDSYSESLLPEDLPGIEKELEKAIATKSRFDTNFRIRTPDKGIRYIIAKAELILGDNGDPVKMIGVNYDISDIKKTEQTLTEAQEIGKIGNWVWEMHEDKITWSDQSYKIFGQSKDFETTFENLNKLTHPDDREAFQKDVEQAIKNKIEHNIVHRIVLNDGKEVRYIHERGKVFYDGDGKPFRMAGTCQDVTLQKQKELEVKDATLKLALSERQLRTFVENAPVAVAMLDNEMAYITASNKWYNEYNIEHQNVVGMSHYEVFPEIKRNERWLEDHKRVLAGEELENDRDKFVRADGSIQWISWKLLPWYDEPGEIGGMIMYTADITNEIKYQEKLENLNEVLEHQVKIRTKELNKANKELESFSYSISHDLRAPLRSINGFADILEEDYKDSLDEEGKRLLRIIKSSGIQMGKLIDDILAFSRLGRKKLKKGEIIIDDLVKEVLEDISLRNDGLNIDFKVENLVNVQGDVALLKQVMVNLVSNAVKYSSKENIIKIGVSSTVNDKKVIYKVTDNGTGFDMKYHDKLFGVFQRLHSANEYEGTGVGLAIVKRIINKHGGEIWAESKIDKGSTFYFSLPVD